MTAIMPDTTTAHARRSDPATSHAAAASLSETTVTNAQAAVLRVLARYGPLADVELVEKYRHVQPRLDLPVQTDSGLRSRRADLVKTGLVALHDEVTINNRKHRRFRALAVPA